MGKMAAKKCTGVPHPSSFAARKTRKNEAARAPSKSNPLASFALAKLKAACTIASIFTEKFTQAAPPHKKSRRKKHLRRQ